MTTNEKEYIEKLKTEIRKVHGVDALHIGTVPVFRSAGRQRVLIELFKLKRNRTLLRVD
jgi:hypothetical protein